VKYYESIVCPFADFVNQSPATFGFRMHVNGRSKQSIPHRLKVIPSLRREAMSFSLTKRCDLALNPSHYFLRKLKYSLFRPRYCLQPCQHGFNSIPSHRRLTVPNLNSENSASTKVFAGNGSSGIKLVMSLEASTAATTLSKTLERELSG
jgi:hypothetical protein